MAISVTGKRNYFSTPRTRKMKRDYAAVAASLSAPEISQRLRNAAAITGAVAAFYGLVFLMDAIQSLPL